MRHLWIRERELIIIADMMERAADPGLSLLASSAEPSRDPRERLIESRVDFGTARSTHR